MTPYISVFRSNFSTLILFQYFFFQTLEGLLGRLLWISDWCTYCSVHLNGCKWSTSDWFKNIINVVRAFLQLNLYNGAKICDCKMSIFLIIRNTRSWFILSVAHGIIYRRNYMWKLYHFRNIKNLGSKILCSQSNYYYSYTWSVKNELIAIDATLHNN